MTRLIRQDKMVHMIGKMAHTVQDDEAEGRMVHMIVLPSNG